MSRITRHIVSILLTWIAFTASATNKEYSFYALSLNDGLSQSTVRSILLDHQSTLWIGTKKGVNIFNQHKLTTLTYQPEDSLSLPDNLVNTISEDSTGTVWVGTATGLSKFNKQKAKFERIHNRGIFSSYASNECCYFGGSNFLLEYNYASGKVESYKVDLGFSDDDRSCRLMEIEPLKNGKLLLGTKEKGIYVFDLKAKQIFHLIDTRMHLLEDICVGSDQKIYVTTQGSGMYQFGQEGELEAKYTTETSEIGTNFLLDLLEIDNELWICTDGEGIKRLNLQTHEFTTLKHVPGDPSTLPTNAITTLF